MLAENYDAFYKVKLQKIFVFFDLGKDFLDATPRSCFIKEKHNKLDK